MMPSREDLWNKELFFSDQQFVCSHHPQGGVFIKIKNNILWVLIEKEASGDDLISCFTRAMQAGWLALSMRTLVDLTNFTGAVDWGAVRAVSEMGAWGTGRTSLSRVAYLVRDGQFAALVKIVSILFPLSSHRPFYDPTDALGWLSLQGARERSAALRL